MEGYVSFLVYVKFNVIFVGKKVTKDINLILLYDLHATFFCKCTTVLIRLLDINLTGFVVTLATAISNMMDYFTYYIK